MEVSVQLWTPTGLPHRAPTLLGISGRTSDRAAGVQEMLSPTSHSPLAFGVSEPETFSKALVKSFYPEDSQKKQALVI